MANIREAQNTFPTVRFKELLWTKEQESMLATPPCFKPFFSLIASNDPDP